MQAEARGTIAAAGSPLRAARHKRKLRLARLPGVHRPVSDTWMLAQAMFAEGVAGAVVADLCTGTGALAIAAARGGAARVSAVDVSLRANVMSRLNARLNGCRVDVRRGDLIEALGTDRFDVVVANPPYIPAETDELPRHRATTPLDGGRDGRLLIDRICRAACAHLRPGGAVLIVHSSICGVEQSCALLEQGGLTTDVADRRRGSLGPVLRARAEMLRARGLLGDADEEELVVVRGRALAR